MFEKASVFSALIVASFGLAHADEHDVWGLWYTPDRMSIIEISDCGDGSPCGVVTWVNTEHGMTVDSENRDHDLRGRPMIGVTLLHGFEKAAHRWGSGAIYNPENGRTYRARLELESNDLLAVSGCLGPICKKLHWERAEELPSLAEAAHQTSAAGTSSLN